MKRTARWTGARYEMDSHERGWPVGQPAYYSYDGDCWYWFARDGAETQCPADGPDFAPAEGLSVSLSGGPRDSVVVG